MPATYIRHWLLNYRIRKPTYFPFSVFSTAEKETANHLAIAHVVHVHKRLHCEMVMGATQLQLDARVRHDHVPERCERAHTIRDHDHMGYGVGTQTETEKFFTHAHKLVRGARAAHRAANLNL